VAICPARGGLTHDRFPNLVFSVRKGFIQSIYRTKEQKTRLQCLASAMPKFAMPSGAKTRKACKEAKRKNLQY